MRMDFSKIIEAISEHKGAAGAAALGVVALGGLAWALSTGPITPTDAETGPAEPMGPNFPVAMGSARALRSPSR